MQRVRGLDSLRSAPRCTVPWSARERSCASGQQGPPRLAGSPNFPLRLAPNPRSGPLGNYPWPASGSATEAAIESFSVAARKRDLRPGVAPHSEQNGNFVFYRAGPAVASRPAPRALPLLRSADWKRPGLQPGWGARARCSRGTAGGARLQAVGEVGGRGPPAGVRRPLRWVPPAGP